MADPFSSIGPGGEKRKKKKRGLVIPGISKKKKGGGEAMEPSGVHLVFLPVRWAERKGRKKESSKKRLKEGEEEVY